jgi:choline dehydrogenase
MGRVLTLVRYFNKFQKYELDPKYPDVKKEATGPVRVGYFSYLADFSRDFVQACTKVGVPLSPDFNTDAGTRGANRVSIIYVSIISF